MFKEIAKKILISSPFSVEYSSLHTPHWLLSRAKQIDMSLQRWVLLQSDFFSEKDWGEVQKKKLKNILVHAGKNVPYWRRLFKKIHFSPEAFNDSAELRRIPTITRAELKEIPPNELIADNIPSWRRVEAYTSGTTGTPLKFYQDKRDNIRRETNTFQEFRYAGIRRDETVVIFGLENHHDLDDIGTRFGMGELEDESIRKKIIYPYITSHAPILVAGTGAVRRLITLVQYDGFDGHILKLKAIFYRGEHLDISSKNMARKLFGCSTFTTYGSRECSLLGIECEDNSLHAVPWMNYLEILDESDNPAAAGVRGSVVITFFENYAMPFIRYRIGDTGKVNEKLCTCGRNSHTIELQGRELILIRVPGYINIPLLNLIKYLEEHHSHTIKQYQFEKKGEILTLRYVPLISATVADEDEIKNAFAREFNYRIKINIQSMPFLEPSAGGKVPVFIEKT